MNGHVGGLDLKCSLKCRLKGLTNTLVVCRGGALRGDWVMRTVQWINSLVNSCEWANSRLRSSLRKEVIEVTGFGRDYPVT